MIFEPVGGADNSVIDSDDGLIAQLFAKALDMQKRHTKTSLSS